MFLSGLFALNEGIMIDQIVITEKTSQAMIAVLPEHQPLPVWKHSGSKRERFAAVSCETRRRDCLGQGVASHGKCEG